jgi:hypothetical protein
MTSAEYSGPLEFVQFWLDVIVEWQKERGRDVLVGLSCPKDVQDAILADPVRGPHVDVIDIRYWCYTADGSLYAPVGGQNLAPRQHLRQTRQKPGGFAQIARAVREYRRRFPDKAVTYYADLNCPSRRDGWAILMGGGSLAYVTRLPAALAAAIPIMRPTDDAVASNEFPCLAGSGGDYLLYFGGRTSDVELNVEAGNYAATWIDARSGQAIAEDEVQSAGSPVRLSAPAEVLWLRRHGPN